MHDEAAAHYIDMMDHTALGHFFLLKEFGVRPTVGWQIDPFGHSQIQVTALGAELGFKGLYFGRIDYQDMAYRQSTKQCEFVWEVGQEQVFTGLTGSYKVLLGRGLCGAILSLSRDRPWWCASPPLSF